MRRRSCTLKALWCALAIGTAPGGVEAESTDTLFAQGNRALLQGEPETALTRYQTLAESGSLDPDLEYNLALAHARLGQLGWALWHLSRAQELRPGDDGVAHAMRRVQDALGKRQAEREGEATVQIRPPLHEAMTAWLSLDSLAVLLWIAGALASLAWIVLQRSGKEGHRIGAGVTLAAALLLGALSGTGLASKAGLLREGTRAIVLEDEVALREGPDDRAPRVRSLAEGTRAEVLEELGDHARVAVGDARGWVPRAALGVF